MAVSDVVARLRELNADLSSAWVAAERLTALRLAIKVRCQPQAMAGAGRPF